MKLRNKMSDKVKNIKILVDGEEYVFGSIYEIIEWLTKYTEYEIEQPLIKDERIRKAVRAWAKLHKLESVSYFAYTSHTELSYLISGSTGVVIDIVALPELEDGGNYTIAGLCGEEKE